MLVGRAAAGGIACSRRLFGLAVASEDELRAKLRRIEALIAGRGTAGERDAVGNARTRLGAAGRSGQDRSASQQKSKRYS